MVVLALPPIIILQFHGDPDIISDLLALVSDQNIDFFGEVAQNWTDTNISTIENRIMVFLLEVDLSFLGRLCTTSFLLESTQSYL